MTAKRCKVSLIAFAIVGCLIMLATIKHRWVNLDEGSLACSQCHPAFYQLWSSSFHGLALRPYAPDLADKLLVDQDVPIQVDHRQYRAAIDPNDPDVGHVIEYGPGGKRIFPVNNPRL